MVISMNQNNKEFLTTKEFAARLGVHWFTVWRWTADKRISFRQSKAGGKILIPASELYRLQAAEIAPVV
jgi:excisionase family DNA binding protein